MTEQQDDAAGRLAAYFQPDGFPGFTLDDGQAWTPQQVRQLLIHHREFLRSMIEPDVREVLRELDAAKTEAFEQRNLAANGYADTVKALQGWDQALLERDEARAEAARFKAERERYIDSYVEWGVRLSGGTHMDCDSEEDARGKARSWRGTLRCCDVLSTDWRDVEPTAAAGSLRRDEDAEPDLSNEPLGEIDV
jgi:hypothetical protein